MNILTMIMLAFSALGALDRIFGNHFGIGKEFERGFMLLGNTALTTIGMIVLSPLLAKLLEPVSQALYSSFGLDPSIIPVSLLANDMGGAPLAVQMARNAELGLFNGLVVSTMLGCTVSYTIPYAMGCVREEKHPELFFGLLCGIVTIPVGCFVGGLMVKLPVGLLLADLLPLVLFSAVVVCGLLLLPKITVKLFSLLGLVIRGIITVGLMLGVLKTLAGIELVPGLADFSEGADICVNAAIVLSGAFPLMYVIAKILARPLTKLGNFLKIGADGAMGFLSTVVSNSASFSLIDRMDSRGVVLNSAFAVGGSFVFGAHLAFTMAWDASYIAAMIVAKLVSGVCGLILAMIVYKPSNRK